MAGNEIDSMLAERRIVDRQRSVVDLPEPVPAIFHRIESIRHLRTVGGGLNLQCIIIADDLVLIAMQDQQGGVAPGDLPAMDKPAPIIDQHVRLRGIDGMRVEAVRQLQRDDGALGFTPDRKSRHVHAQLIMMVFSPAQRGDAILDGTGETVGLACCVRSCDPRLTGSEDRVPQRVKLRRRLGGVRSLPVVNRKHGIVMTGQVLRNRRPGRVGFCARVKPAAMHQHHEGARLGTWIARLVYVERQGFRSGLQKTGAIDDVGLARRGRRWNGRGRRR